MPGDKLEKILEMISSKIVVPQEKQLRGVRNIILNVGHLGSGVHSFFFFFRKRMI